MTVNPIKKIAVFDCDGVVVLNKPRFSQRLAQKQHIPESAVLEFFNGPMIECILGQADLKEVIQPYLSKWHWSGSVDSLLNDWFESESTLNQDLIKLIKQAPAQNIPCYLATNQEKYRTQYLADNLGLLHLFAHLFVSSEIGAKKPQAKFYQYVIDSLEYLENISSPAQIYFWDDRPNYIEAARKQRINAHLYTSVGQVKQMLGL